HPVADIHHRQRRDDRRRRLSEAVARRMRRMGDERGCELEIAECRCRRREVQEEGAVSVVISLTAYIAVSYLYEMITCSIPAGGLINSLRENPALANIFSYSEKV